MSLYQRFFARCLACGDGAQERLYGDRKRRLFAEAQGTVLEIGPGTGVNLAYLPDGVRWIGLEPNPYMHRFIHDKAERLRAEGRDLTVEVRTDPAATSGLPDGHVDVVISTLVLCSVPDVAAVLAEVRRVLRRGGRFLFIEHVAAPPDSWLCTVQHGIKPLWRPLADGCHPDRALGAAIEQAGFRELCLDRFRANLPLSPITPHIGGTAVA